MPEIERKFLLTALPPEELVSAVHVIAQGYIIAEEWELRARRMNGRCLLTVKGDGTISREEWETDVPEWVFVTLWPKTEGRRIEKRRHSVPDAGLTMEVDEYQGALQGLIIMEREFPTLAASEQWILPAWAANAKEVTHDKRYRNKALAVRGLPTETE
jgi:adenylate cyclase